MDGWTEINELARALLSMLLVDSGNQGSVLESLSKAEYLSIDIANWSIGLKENTMILFQASFHTFDSYSILLLSYLFLLFDIYKILLKDRYI